MSKYGTPNPLDSFAVASGVTGCVERFDTGYLRLRYFICLCLVYPKRL